MTFQFLSPWGRALLRLSRKLWLRVSLFALLALFAAALAILFEDAIPAPLQQRFTPDAVLPILTILASGMLAVSTFSLNVMVTAHNAAAANATPRVHRILLADTTTHTVLAIFIGAFVYALSAIILFKARIYPEGASVLVLGFTVIVVMLVVLALLRWIHHLSDLGSMDATLDSTETMARACLRRARRWPSLGAAVLSRDMVLPDDAAPLRAPATGYLQIIDIQGLAARLTSDATRVYLYARPGDYLIKGETIGHATGLDEAGRDAVMRRLTIGACRTFEQDASYGLLVLSETASRALSPGVNDPGTAIAVICRLEKLLLEWSWAEPDTPMPRFRRVVLPDTSRRAMIDNAFAGAARDGAGQIEVAQRLRAALLRVAEAPDLALAEAAREMLGRAQDHADAALPLDSDRARLRAVTGRISPLP